MCLEQGIISNINQYAAPKRKQPGRKDPTPSKKTRGAHLNDEYKIGHNPGERTRTMLRSPDSNDRSEGGENDLELKNAANGAGARS